MTWYNGAVVRNLIGVMIIDSNNIEKEIRGKYFGREWTCSRLINDGSHNSKHIV